MDVFIKLLGSDVFNTDNFPQKPVVDSCHKSLCCGGFGIVNKPDAFRYISRVSPAWSFLH